MNLHIFQDSIGHYASQTYERLRKIDTEGRENLFINLTDQIDGTKIEGVVQFNRNWPDVLHFINKIDDLNRVYFHCYNHYSQYLLRQIRKVNKDVLFVWIFWSGEFYNLPEFLPEIYLGYSQQFIPPIYTGFWKKIKSKVFNFREWAFQRPYYIHRNFIRSFNKIGFFAGVLQEDYNTIINYSGAKMKYTQFAYLSYDQFVKKDLVLPAEYKQPNKFKLMINHSGDPTLNHFDVFERLENISYSGEIVLPLAYGDEKYMAEIKDYANTQWKDRVIFWDTFSRPEEYVKKQEYIDFAVFNSKIQQGFGNIIALLWFGVKIFFREENSIYIDFKRWGIKVFSIQSDFTEEHLVSRLSEEEIEQNRVILKKYLSNDVVNGYYKSLIELQLKENGN